MNRGVLFLSATVGLLFSLACNGWFLFSLGAHQLLVRDVSLLKHYNQLLLAAFRLAGDNSGGIAILPPGNIQSSTLHWQKVGLPGEVFLFCIAGRV